MKGLVYTCKLEFNKKPIVAEVVVRKLDKEVVEDFKTLRVYHNHKEFTKSLTNLDYAIITRKVSRQVDMDISKILEVLDE